MIITPQTIFLYEESCKSDIEILWAAGVLGTFFFHLNYYCIEPANINLSVNYNLLLPFAKISYNRTIYVLCLPTSRTSIPITSSYNSLVPSHILPPIHPPPPPPPPLSPCIMTSLCYGCGAVFWLRCGSLDLWMNESMEGSKIQPPPPATATKQHWQ